MAGILCALPGAVTTSSSSGGGGGGGGSSGSVVLNDQTVFDQAFGSATAIYKIASSGLVKDQSGGAIDTWLLSGTASSYEVRATVTSGTLTSGTSGSWISCSSDVSWAKSNTAQNNSTKTVVLTVEIRAVATPATVIDSASIILEAESDNLQ